MNRYDSIVTFILNNNNYFEDFITRNTYHSNKIEGNTLSFAETYAIIFNDNNFTVNAQPREIYEAINHKYAFDYMIKNIHQDLSLEMIKQIGILINKNINEIDGFRKTNVYIKGAEYVPPQSVEVPQKMMYFIHNYQHTVYNNIFEKMAINHIEFERIHPFSDGNGRTGRLLLNYELLRNNMAPIVIPEDARTKYFNMLAKQDINALQALFKNLNMVEEKKLEQFSLHANHPKSKTGMERS